MHALAQLCVRRPVFATMLITALVVVGIFSYYSLGVDLFPKVDIPLFAIAQYGTVRVQVDVPQSEAVSIQEGQKASIVVKERMGREYTGTIVRTASALDNAARTMLTEIQVDNRDGSLLPGMYAQVKFTLPHGRTSFLIPTSSLVIDQGGMHVVSVDAEGRIHFVPVTVGRDMGTQIEVLHGLTGPERLVSSPNDLLNDGQTVEVR
ncbi:MAG: efflux RND transporter periplasmic adaptor subunit [Ignavibacteriota bacterium]